MNQLTLGKDAAAARDASIHIRMCGGYALRYMSVTVYVLVTGDVHYSVPLIVRNIELYGYVYVCTCDYG